MMGQSPILDSYSKTSTFLSDALTPSPVCRKNSVRYGKSHLFCHAADDNIPDFFACKCNTHEIAQDSPWTGCLRGRPRSPCAMPVTAGRRASGHRMRDLVCEERDPCLFHHLGVPRSTVVSWIRRGPRPVVTADVLSLDHAE